MRRDELWTEVYQGEVLGEALFTELASRQTDPERRHQLEVLAELERATKALAEPVLDRRGLDHRDTADARAAAHQMAGGVDLMAWDEFLGSFEPVTTQYLVTYRELVDLAGDDDDERRVAEAYVAHEQALMSFVRRSLGQEPGEPLGEILALPHVGAGR